MGGRRTAASAVDLQEQEKQQNSQFPHIWVIAITDSGEAVGSEDFAGILGPLYAKTAADILI